MNCIIWRALHNIEGYVLFNPHIIIEMRCVKLRLYKTFKIWLKKKRKLKSRTK